MIVVDTNVISELMRPVPSPSVVGWLRDQDADELHTTSVNYAEIGFGIERLPEGRRKKALQTNAAEIFASYQDRILPFDFVAATHYVRIVRDRERAGAPIDGFDAQIAAVCRARRARIATRNVDDFRGTGVEIVNPWDGPLHARR